MPNSKVVTSNQTDIHDDLGDILSRYTFDKYQRPIAEHSLKTLGEIKSWIKEKGSRELILDMGCGTGESSFHLAQKYPDKLILGIDKSLSRLERNNTFKADLPANVKLMRGELLDMWYLLYQHKLELNIFKQYILYPNPWPKKKLVKRRFHANPIWPFLINLATRGELRTNWEIYAREFEFVAKNSGVDESQLSSFIPKAAISNFELKYHQSGHPLYKFTWSKSI